VSTLRLSFFAGAVLCFASLAIAYFYMERHLLLEPCPLCILDRIVVFVMGCAFLLSAFSGTYRRKVLWSVNLLALALGFVFAGRHVWQQYQPVSESANCLSDGAVAANFTEVIRRAFGAEGDCGAIYWEFLGLSIPELVLILFGVFSVLLAAQLVWLRK
jgi:disulfide bond formation protein DsbB